MLQVTLWRIQFKDKPAWIEFKSSLVESSATLYLESQLQQVTLWRQTVHSVGSSAISEVTL